ncbi:hypothetical protein OU994_20950 [Pseudoduganella sp. SL102]|uniref:hypothetical protein n=1 Tax=Pseudoduganella sp. SL102 TaxID=2995154 RepID=UPI00248CC9FE|nr:hypothetical protein [Pseudoduganella sp. SL102]WBS00768.1 hypothetical protein OU994_20950 [Pseudoduganella sp. SL102]
MTEKNKPAPEEKKTGNKNETPAPTAESTPTSPVVPTAMLIPEDPNEPTVKG